MNTTAAALQAHVTIPTIRTWCRIGAITAVKQAGRWVIDTTSLAARIAIGAMRARKQPPMTYQIDETTTVQYGQERTLWTIVRTDGTPGGYGPGQDSRIGNATFSSRDRAEIMAAVLNQLPDGYSVHRREIRFARSSMSRNYWVWEVTDRDGDDPKPLSSRIPLDTDLDRDTLVAHLVNAAREHADGRSARIAEKAEKQAVAAAETTVRDAREQQLAEARRRKGSLATPQQVDYILQLLALRERTGEGGGFFNGPTSRAGIQELSKAEASAYITSLKGDY